MNRKKIILSIAVFCLALMTSFSLTTNTKTAQAITQKQVKTKISSLEKQIKKLKAKQKKAEASEKKQKKGTTAVFGTVISFNPFILSDSVTGSYYWITNSGNMTRIVTTASGYLKLTGKYKKYNGITCAVGKAVKVTSKSISIKNKLEKKKKTLQNYKNSLKEKIEFDDSYSKVVVGTSERLSWEYQYSGIFNNVKWKSSDNSIATVNSLGIITAKKTGTVTITATCSLSKKTTKHTVYIIEDTEDEDYDDDEDDNYSYNNDYIYDEDYYDDWYDYFFGNS